MKLVKLLGAVGTVVAAVGTGFGEVVTWPAAPGTAATDGAYQVTVNGKSVDVCYIEKPSMADGQLQWKNGPDNLHPYYFTMFDADEEVEVTVTSTNDLSKTRILPTRRGIRPSECSAHRVVFRAKPPFKLSFEPQVRHRALVLSAHFPERNAPKSGDKDVLWFGPGRHHFDKPIALGKGQTLYLAPGAWVEAAVLGRDCDGARICGRGVLSGLCWNWCKGPRGHMLEVGGRDVTIEDITIVGAWQWCIVLEACTNAKVRGINILNGHVLNDDGIDVVRSKGVTIEDVFIRTQDDCITPKYWCEDLKVRNVILWTDVANIFRIGYECLGKGHRFGDFDVRGVDVLHQSIHKPAAGKMWSENAVYIQASNDMPFENMTFADFRFDAPEAGDNFACIRTQITRDQWQQHKLPGDIRNITFDDVAFPNGLPEGAETVWLENIDDSRTVDGIFFRNLGHKLPVTVKGKVTNWKMD